MKKSIVVLLVLLAAVVLVSPAIVGRLAEHSMDENLNWAAAESGEVRITSQHFSRGWFSSEGQHRIELQDGDLLQALRHLAGPVQADELPVLIVNTRLDHGLIPVTSMGRDKGSLAPGLGSAVSSLALELPDGDTVDIPGTVYSKVALNGELRSTYVLEAGSHDAGGTSTSWGPTEIDVTTNPASGAVVFTGSVGSLSAAGGGRTIDVGGLTFDGRQRPTRFGVMVGDLEVALDALSVRAAGADVAGLKSMSAKISNGLDGERFGGNATLRVATHALPDLGEIGVAADVRLAGADATALGRVQRALDGLAASADPMADFGAVEDDLKALFASGFELDFERLDVTLPQGTVTTRMQFHFAEEDPATFEWTSLLLATEADVDLRIPQAIVELVAEAYPQAGAVIGMGYLVKQGDAYAMRAQFKKGLLTVNGAPIPIPLGPTR